MPRDDSNVEGQIEPQDALDALRAALEEAARETVGDSNDNGNGAQAPTAEREVDRMLREWRAEAHATLRRGSGERVEPTLCGASKSALRTRGEREKAVFG